QWRGFHGRGSARGQRRQQFRAAFPFASGRPCLDHPERTGRDPEARQGLVLAHARSGWRSGSGRERRDRRRRPRAPDPTAGDHGDDRERSHRSEMAAATRGWAAVIGTPLIYTEFGAPPLTSPEDGGGCFLL